VTAPFIPVPSVIPKEVHPQAAAIPAREHAWNRVMAWIAIFVLLGLLGHLAVLLWAKHDFTPVEELVVLHSHMFAQGGGLYWDLKHYPFTVSPYGPIFYVVSGYFHKWGIPSYQAGRVISFAGLLASLWMCWLGVSYLTTNRHARNVGVILAASTSNVLFWGTTGQVDMLACCFSLAAFVSFLKFRERGDVKTLAFSGLLVILAVFTKQTFMASGATIGLTLLWEGRRQGDARLSAAAWIASVSMTGVGIALALNAATNGGYFKAAIFANINPFAWFKLQQHVHYLILTGSGVILTAAVGAWNMSRRTAPVYIYAALATGIWLVTAPKIGSDLNYQIEMMLVLSMCAACALDRVDFFPSLFSARQTWVTLLQVPLLLHVVLNLLLTARAVAVRAAFDSIKGQETAALKPYVDRPGRLLSGHYDSLVQYRGRIEVEPFIYILLVRAGMIDPEPLRHDLETRQFATLILGGDLSAGSRAAEDNLELVNLPDAQLDAIRRNYLVVKRIKGPNDLYIYEPRRD
jgi:Dolichyl-phosphate-mannose-protein mannosyltransferase